MTEAGTAHELAQVDIARRKVPIDSPQLKDSVDNIDPVSADAEAADGFVRRLQGPEGNAADVPVFDDTGLIVNMSVGGTPTF